MDQTKTTLPNKEKMQKVSTMTIRKSIASEDLQLPNESIWPQFLKDKLVKTSSEKIKLQPKGEIEANIVASEDYKLNIAKKE